MTMLIFLQMADSLEVTYMDTMRLLQYASCDIDSEYFDFNTFIITMLHFL